MGRASRSKRERREVPERVLYHFTSQLHLPLIEEDGFLRTTESNLSYRREHAGPSVVWLLDTPTVDYSHGLSGFVDKTAVRITVRTRAERWTEWVRRQRAYDPSAVATLVRTGGGEAAAAHWWVTERPIHRRDWIAVDVSK